MSLSEEDKTILANEFEPTEQETQEAAEIIEASKRKVENEIPEGISKRVFYPSVIILVALVALALIIPTGFNTAISWLSTHVINNLSWYYVLVATGFVGFAAVLAFSRFGDIKLGRDDEEPEYSRGAWFSMLFAAGMGIGLVFYGAGEPLSHFAAPRPGVTGSPAILAREAVSATYLHWGLHAWSIYVIVGLAIAYAHFRRNRPVSIRWTLEPVMGEKRVRGTFGDVIDTVASIGTILGIATSLGFGVNQVAAGMEYLWGFNATRTVLVILVIVISGLAALSVASGLDNGIRLLSNTNLILAALLAFSVAALGPTVFILSEFVQTIGMYLSNFLEMAFQTLPFQGVDGSTWLTSWTTYYWGWWMSWSPFVGIFIARISKGRTIREFIIGVIAVPTLVTFLWFAVMGGNALAQELFSGNSLIGPDGVDINTVLFHSFEALPGAPILSGVAMILVTIFFITSSDSGSYVLSMLSTAGNPNPPLYVRLTWATMAGLVTATLLGTSDSETGMAALQSLAILSALPFSFVMIGMCQGPWKSLSAEHRFHERQMKELRRKMLVETISEQVTQDLEDGAGQQRTKWSSSPIPIAPEIVSVIRRHRKRRKGDANHSNK